MGLFDGKKGLVFGVANDRSIATAISLALHREGAEIGYTHLPGDKSQNRVRKAIETTNPKFLLSCDVQKDDELDAVFAAAKAQFGTLDFLVHSVAFANREDLQRPYTQASRAGWLQSMEISAYSLVAMARRAAELMPHGGTIVTLTYFGGEKVMPGYNLMGICKAALEHSVRYLAYDLGPKNIRVNALSAGPMKTLASAGISDFEEMQERQAMKASLKRNVTFEELGTTGLYLLSHLSGGVTGETIHVDAGFSIVGI